MADLDGTQPGALWVFAYGSLIWKPGFDYLERRIARLDGYQRRFGLTSHHYRGTPDAPGLVLGLDWSPSDSCTGVAFRICPTKDRATREYLVARELVSYAYFETLYPVTLLDEGPGKGETRPAITYVLDRSHPQYAGVMTPNEQAKIIAHAVGRSGTNVDYLESTRAKLSELGIEDSGLDTMARLVEAAQ